MKEAEHCSICSDGAHIRVEVLSQPRYLAGVREMVLAVAGRLGFGEAGAGHIALAIDEALANVIRHGYGGACDRPIFLAIAPLVEDGVECGIRVCIEDHAQKVDPSKIKSRDLETVRPGGLGVHIIQEIMDEVSYTPRDEDGMKVVMVKRLTGDRPCCGSPGACQKEGEGDS